MRGIDAERILRRGVWFWCLFCLLSSVMSWTGIPTGAVTMATLWALPLASGFLLRQLGLKPFTAPQNSPGRSNGMVLDAAAASYGFLLYAATATVLRRWSPLLVVALLFCAAQARSLILQLLEILELDSRWIYKYTQALSRVAPYLRHQYDAWSLVRNPLIRLPLLFMIAAAFAFFLSALTISGTFSEFQHTMMPVARLQARAYRLRLARIIYSLLGRRYIPIYTYQPIMGGPMKQPKVRLLRLLRRWPFGHIRCELVDANLDDALEFDALSYHWGKAVQTEPIYIDGQAFLVTPTVLAALFHLSSYRRSRLLWIDSICINQDDGDEKAAQIPLMKTIYSRASRVVIWLDNVRDPWLIRTMLAGILHEHAYGSAESCLQLLHKYSESYAEAGWMQLMNLFAHPWFFRIWVIQELAMASTAVVLASGEMLDWDRIEAVARILYSPPYNLVQLRSTNPGVDDDFPRGQCHVLMMSNIRRMRKHSDLDLGHLLGAFSDFRSTEKVDRIYGLLGLISPTLAEQPWLKPSATKSAETLYTDVARHLMPTNHHALFSYSGIGYQRNLHKLPSWVPDWTSLAMADTQRQNLINTQNAAMYNASAGSRLDMSFHQKTTPHGCESHIMAIRGHCFDEVWHVGAVHTYAPHHGGRGASSSELGAVIVPHMRARSLATQQARQPYPTGEAIDEAFWRCLIGNTQFSRPAPTELGVGCRLWERITVAASSLNLDELRDDTNTLPSAEEITALGQAEEAGRQALLWNSTRVMCCTGRAFCVTRSGYMALVPPGTVAGDLVCVLYGLNTPFILRRCAEGGSVNLVGEAYVHGMMDGEAMAIDCDKDELFNLV
ncbi:heterokaryon incompatibility protein-domain-containing protein [Cladorrhinum sp. PSN259]|nr:heterokaryon incompatibility protein-domain-containing protein [Cladorrhinum sp. PSN259]